MIPEHLADPLRWRKPRRIFVNSMSDLFHESLSNEQIAQVFGVMAKAYWHTFQVLTKRPERAVEWFEWAAGGRHVWPAAQLHPWPDWALREVNRGAGDVGWPLRHVWIGASVENQATADERIPHLLRVPAAVRFLSCEPLLSAVDLLTPTFNGADSFSAMADIHWVIAGTESGPRRRPADMAWLRDLRDQCVGARTPFFLKQMEVDGRVAHAPELDGRQWSEFPAVTRDE